MVVNSAHVWTKSRVNVNKRHHSLLTRNSRPTLRLMKAHRAGDLEGAVDDMEKAQGPKPEEESATGATSEEAPATEPASEEAPKPADEPEDAASGEVEAADEPSRLKS